MMILSYFTKHTRSKENLDKIGEWVKTWQMKFNKDKCKVIEYGGKKCKIDSMWNRIWGIRDGKRPWSPSRQQVEKR